MSIKRWRSTQRNKPIPSCRFAGFYQPQELGRRIRQSTAGDGWVVDGSYREPSHRLFWSRLQCVVWLDLPMPLLVWLVIVRAWQRSRTKELLWGKNYERFWPQLMGWNKDESLIGWIVSQHHRKRRDMIADMAAPPHRSGHLSNLLKPACSIQSSEISILLHRWNDLKRGGLDREWHE